MNEQRKDILDLLAAGEVTAAEAEQLIAAIERDQPPAAPGLDPAASRKYLRVLVDAVENGEPGRVNVRVPLQLLRAGVRLAALNPTAGTGPRQRPTAASRTYRRPDAAQARTASRPSWSTSRT